MMENEDQDARRVLTPKLANVYVTDESIAKIRAETGIDRDYRDDELRHWLWEATRQHSVYSLSDLPWQRVVDHAEDMQSASRRLLRLLDDPCSTEAFPSIGDPFRQQMLERVKNQLRVLTGNLRDAAEILGRQKTSRGSLKGIGADCILVGAHLPFIFRILYGTVRKGEGKPDSRTRFIAGCCEALGMRKPAHKTILDHRTRFRRHCVDLGEPYLAFYQNDGHGLLPPRNPSPEAAGRIRDWNYEIAVAEDEARAAADDDDFSPPDRDGK